MSPFRVVIFFVVLSIVGLAVLSLQSVDLLPGNQEPKLSIAYSMPDASPEYMEQEATAQLENVLSQVAGIKSIYSVSNYNHATIELTFEKEEDIAYKKFEIGAVIRRIYPRLNKLLSYPIIHERSRESDNKSPILIYNINGLFTAYQLREYCEEYMQKPLSNIDGIKQVVISGAEPLQISLKYQTDKLLAYNITRAEILNQIRESLR